MDEMTHPGPRPPLAELERQVERGSMFTQAVFQKSFSRLSTVEAMVHELLSVLEEKGVVSADDLPGAAAIAAQEEAREAAEPEPKDPTMRWPAIAIRVEPTEPAQLEPVDCDARMSICHAVCCKLKFALSNDEIEQGLVKWDIGHPYIIRQNSDGYCCHNDAGSGGCTIYNDRPNLCRRYSCRGDKRIWKDFDNMVLNQPWIDEHISGADAFLLVEDGEASAADLS